MYDTPARLAVGNLGRTGSRSCELSAKQGGKVRLLSEKLHLAPGRYRVQLHPHGPSIGKKGRWGRALDFSTGYDNRYHALGQVGSFGWTAVNYVFEIGHPVDDFRLSVGLWEGGWLWIDDVALETVGAEAPIAPPPAADITCPPSPWFRSRGPRTGRATTASGSRCTAPPMRRSLSWSRFAILRPRGTGPR